MFFIGLHCRYAFFVYREMILQLLSYWKSTYQVSIETRKSYRLTLNELQGLLNQQKIESTKLNGVVMWKKVENDEEETILGCKRKAHTALTWESRDRQPKPLAISTSHRTADSEKRDAMFSERKQIIRSYMFENPSSGMTVAQVMSMMRSKNGKACAELVNHTYVYSLLASLQTEGVLMKNKNNRWRPKNCKRKRSL